MRSDRFDRALAHDLTGDAHARLVHIGNFEIERDWAAGSPGLPGGGLSFTAATVNGLSEMAVFLAGPGDVVLLKQPLDPGYRDYLDGLGVATGSVLTPERTEPDRRVTADLLASPDLLERLRDLADGNTYLVPLGVGEDEEELSARTGLPLTGPGARLSRAVNSKIFSRDLVDRNGLRSVPGFSCTRVDEIGPAVEKLLRPGGRVVVKEALGVSGRGQVVFGDLDKATRFLRLLARRGDRLDVVVEEWIDKDADLNYQFVVTPDGRVVFRTIKVAVVENGVHRGHRFPVDLPGPIEAGIRQAAELIGKDLAARGWTGLAGVDAMLTRDGVLYPCLEINARFNMATYQDAVAAHVLGPGRYAEAGTIELKLDSPKSFQDLSAGFGDLLLTGSGGTGLVVTNFATVNAQATPGRPFRGRLGVVGIGDSPAAAAGLRTEILRRMAS